MLAEEAAHARAAAAIERANAAQAAAERSEAESAQRARAARASVPFSQYLGGPFSSSEMWFISSCVSEDAEDAPRSRALSKPSFDPNTPQVSQHTLKNPKSEYYPKS